MSLNNPIMGEGYIPAYQISATPWVTSYLISLGQIQVMRFPQITRFINIKNAAAGATDKIAIAFTERGFSTGNFFSLSQGSSLAEEIRTDRLFVSCSVGTGVAYQMLVGLTGIPSGQFQIITGSSGFEGVG